MMSMYLPRFSKVVFGLALTVSLTSAAIGQDKLLDALKQKYPITEITTTGEIANPGAVMVLQANGINAEPYPTMITFENPIVDGRVQQRSKFTGFVKSTNMRILHPGDKVYITKIHDKLDDKNNDFLKITIITCDMVDAYYANAGGMTKKRLSTTLSFKQPKGSLEGMSLDDVSHMIEAIMSPDSSGGPGEQAPPQQAPPQETASSTAQTIAIGQTIDQVTATMGQPRQIVDLGSKKIYTYPDLKIIFLNGKVSDVQ